MIDEARALVAVQERSYANAGSSISGSWPQSDAMDAERMAAFLERKQYAVLATASPDGRPQAAPIAFDVVGGARRGGAGHHVSTGRFRRIAGIAHDPDAAPQAVPCFWIATVAGARLRNLRAMPYGSLVIAEGERGEHRALRAEGPVTLHEGDALAAAWARLEAHWLERHGSAPTTWAAAFIELRPERVFSYDAS